MYLCNKDVLKQNVNNEKKRRRIYEVQKEKEKKKKKKRGGGVRNRKSECLTAYSFSLLCCIREHSVLTTTIETPAQFQFEVG